MFSIFIQDEGQSNAVFYDTHADAATAKASVDCLVEAMESSAQAACDTAVARAELDIDGDVVWAAWHTIPGSDIRSLVAIVNEP